ncbi:MAG: DnaA family protein [Gammaproteobacteria bacterium]|jgi:DnaA family protein
MSSQIPLPLGNFDHYSFDIFVSGQNQQVVDYLNNMVSANTGDFVYLWGNSGTGKSHLLQAVCGEASSCGMKPGYIPLSEHNQLVPDILNGFETLDLVCIDDLHCIAGLPEWEKSLFNLFNDIVENNKSLVVTTTMSPSGNTIVLPDLKSRLGSGVTYHLKYLSEDERMYALKQRASLRGFDLSNDVLDYLSKRVARDMHTLFNWLDRMDEAIYITKKKLTVSMVRDLLDEKY